MVSYIQIGSFFGVFVVCCCGPLGTPPLAKLKTKDVQEANFDRINKREIQSFSNEVNIIDAGLMTHDDVSFIEAKSAPRNFNSYFNEFSLRIANLEKQLQNVEKQMSNVIDRLTLLDCYDLKLQQPLAMSGVYNFHLDYKGKRPVGVACDMSTDGGGWTIIQQRLPREYNDTKSHTSFNRGFYDYMIGFGNPEEDYWIGLENIYMWTNTRHYELRVHVSDFKGEPGHAHYTKFHIGDEDEAYKLHVSGYSGDIGDALGMEGKLDNFTAEGMMFSTHDEDRDTSHEINCSAYWNIGGWWLNRCSWSNLNAPYKFPDEGDGIGINWHTWKNEKYLKSTKMMIRPSKKP